MELEEKKWKKYRYVGISLDQKTYQLLEQQKANLIFDRTYTEWCKRQRRRRGANSSVLYYVLTKLMKKQLKTLR